MKSVQKKERGLLAGSRRLYRSPKAFLAAEIQAQTSGIQIASMMLVGMGLCSYFAQLFSLGKLYPVGKIAAGILILGPVLGLLFFLTVASLAFWSANFFDQKSLPALTIKNHLPPFPLKNLLFKRLASPDSFDKLFKLPVLKQYQKAWSWLRSGLQYCRARFGKGPIGFGTLFSMLNTVSGPIFWATTLAGISIFWGNDQFSLFEGGFFSLLLILFQTIAIFVSLWFWTLALQLAYNLSWPRALIFASASFCFALCSIMGLVSFFIGIRLF